MHKWYRVYNGVRKPHWKLIFLTKNPRSLKKCREKFLANSSMLPSGTIGPVGKKTTLSHLTVWGPIPAATAERLGLPSEVESVLIRPTALNVARAAEAVLKIVPPDVLPVEGDTAESLVARLERSDWLDDMEVKKSGQAKGGKHVHLNRVDYPQPRRKSWSVLLKEELEDEDGDHVHLLLAYKVPAKASSWHCTVTTPTHDQVTTHAQFYRACRAWLPDAAGPARVSPTHFHQRTPGTPEGPGTRPPRARTQELPVPAPPD